MIAFPIASLPEGFSVANAGPGRVTVVFDVTRGSLGTWIGCAAADGDLHLFPERSYKQADLAKRLGVPVPDEP